MEMQLPSWPDGQKVLIRCGTCRQGRVLGELWVTPDDVEVVGYTPGAVNSRPHTSMTGVGR